MNLSTSKIKDLSVGKLAEVRSDRAGKITLMVRESGYVMVRRPRAIPFVMSEKDWDDEAAWAELLSVGGMVVRGRFEMNR